jgi:hypothetical protein
MKSISINKQQGSVHIVIISIIALAIVGALSFLLIQNLQKKDEVVDTTQPTEYVRTTTVPTDWKTFTSDKYKVSISYPSDLCVKLFDNQDHGTIGLTQSSCDLSQSFLVGVDVDVRNLDETVDSYKNYDDDDYNDILITVISEKKIKFDGYDGVELRYTDNNESDPKRVQKDIFVYANGYTYTLMRTYETELDTPLDFELTAEEALIILESIKITD